MNHHSQQSRSLASRRKLKKGETLFADPKRIVKLNRFLLRDPNAARDEFHLAAIAQNLGKMASMKLVLGHAMA